MNQTILDLIKKPLAVSSTDLFIIEDEIETYPYFQTLHLLKSKASKNADEKAFKDVLGLTSIYTSNRKTLFDYLHTFDDIKSEALNLDTESNSESETSNDNIPNQKTTYNQENTVQLNIDKIEHKEEFTEKQLTIIDNQEEGVEIKHLKTNSIEPIIEKKNIIDLDLKNNEDNIQLNHEELQPFNSWLKANTNHSFTPDKIDTTKEELEAKYKIIDNFLENKPKISPVKDFTPSKKKSNSKESMSHLMTETLADLYVKQNKFNKALDAYSILSLKYPEKSSYFADRIKEIKDLKNK